MWVSSPASRLQTHPPRIRMSRRHCPRLVSFAGLIVAILAVVSGGLPIAIGQPPKGPVVTPAPQAPTLNTPANMGAKPGATTELTLTGTNLAEPVGVLLSCPGAV